MGKGRKKVGTEKLAGGLRAAGRIRVKGYIQSGHSWSELLKNRMQSSLPHTHSTHTLVFQNDLI